MGTPIDLDKMRSIGVISGVTKSRVIDEGHSHAESGLAFKTTRDELGHDTTVHSESGSGVDSRQDININAKSVHLQVKAVD